MSILSMIRIRCGLSATVLGLTLCADGSAQGIGGGLEVVDAAARITEKLGTTVPMDLQFVDENRNPVTVGQYFQRGKPVILNLGYYGCPTMCGLVLNGFVAGLQDLKLTPAEDFTVLTVSIHPDEKPSLARAKKNSVFEVYTKANTSEHWHFLTGTQASIESLTKAVGFGYRWQESSRQYDHDAGLVFLSPQGQVMRYLYGTAFSPRDLKYALIETTQGKIGSTIDRILLSCLQYDPSTRTYSVAVWTIVRVAGAVTVLLLAGMIIYLFRRERRVLAATP